MERVIRSLFVLTLVVSIVGGILFVLAQIVALTMGSLDLLKALNGTWKEPLVLTCSLCAVVAFALQYLDPRIAEEAEK